MFSLGSVRFRRFRRHPLLSLGLLLGVAGLTPVGQAQTAPPPPTPATPAAKPHAKNPVVVLTEDK
ncbi:MAG: hypothetical protein JWN14_4860, partial [Chthonomonadales bacterium]|nr:hypothetical protein [Chthonomonadales bacterium]